MVELRFAPGENEKVGDSLEAVRSEGGLGSLVSRVEVLPDRVLLYADDGDEANATRPPAGFAPISVLVRRSTLEDVFLRLTGRTLVD